ncbi:MAG TPA: 50S ribosomal protein L3, partial [bacterium]|nr:50S ribosomal protein L3 [bacterium]
MKKALIGRKLGMSQVFKEDGTIVPVTVCELGPCVVVQKKNEEKDGYGAIKLGFLDTRENRLTRPVAMDLKKKDIPFKKVFREVPLYDETLDEG